MLIRKHYCAERKKMCDEKNVWWKKNISLRKTSNSCDITQILKVWPNSKCHNSKTQSVTKLKLKLWQNSKCQKTQKLKMWQNSNSNCDKTPKPKLCKIFFGSGQIFFVEMVQK